MVSFSWQAHPKVQKGRYYLDLACLSNFYVFDPSLALWDISLQICQKSPERCGNKVYIVGYGAQTATHLPRLLSLLCAKETVNLFLKVWSQNYM